MEAGIDNGEPIGVWTEPPSLYGIPVACRSFPPTTDEILRACERFDAEQIKRAVELLTRHGYTVQPPANQPTKGATDGAA